MKIVLFKYLNIFDSYNLIYFQQMFSYKKLNKLPDWVGHGTAGAVATLFHDAIMTPAEGKLLY